MRIGHVAAMIAAAALAAGCQQSPVADANNAQAANEQGETAEKATPGEPTRATYDRISLGSTYEEVVALIGREADETRPSESSAGAERITYIWREPTSGGSLTLLYGDGRMLSKSQSSLR